MIDCPLGSAAVHFRGKVHAMIIHLLDGKKMTSGSSFMEVLSSNN